MKFALQLSESLVPEWRDQYLDYKGGKKLLKKIGKNASKPPLSEQSKTFSFLGLSGVKTPTKQSVKSSTQPSSGTDTNVVTPAKTPDIVSSLNGLFIPPSLNSQSDTPDSTQTTVGDSLAQATNYGSTQNIANNNLPVSPPLKRQNDDDTTEAWPLLKPDPSNIRPVQRAYTELPMGTNSKGSFSLKSIVNKISGRDSLGKGFDASLVSSQNNAGPHPDTTYTVEEQTFIDWLNGELGKIETFYKKKESDSAERYLVLQDQLFNLRERKQMQKANHEERVQPSNKKREDSNTDTDTNSVSEAISYKLNKRFDLPSLPMPLHNKLFGSQTEQDEGSIQCIHDHEDQKPGSSSDTPSSSSAPAGSNSRTQEGEIYSLRQNPGTQNQGPSLPKSANKSDEPGTLSLGHKKDYIKHNRDNRISYGVAQRQLKLAVVELYRELEMLKSYRDLNQTAFRKMIKKFDKVTGHNSQATYMAKVKKSYFTQSESLNDLIRKTEDLFAGYFEGGNHKRAVEKLRANTVHEEHYTEMFLTGLFLGLSVPIAVRATYKGIIDMNEGDPDALFLFQIWGGFFLAVLFLCLFAVNCVVWTLYKVNYSFVFEFNPLNHLNAKQVGSVPSFLLFMLSFLAWLCFEDFWPERLPQIYYPLIYLALVLGILLWPYRGFHREARKWLTVAFWRVSFSGLYPVEFRDLIMGDISCSLTYTISNVAFFFCLYATHWSGLIPGDSSGSRCGSSHSRWMGFLSALPGIWRFLQCGRRYLDSGDMFPHLANMGKYGVQISYNAFLSAYRINLSSNSYHSLFLIFATLNTLYSGFWDLFMDWSVMQFTSKNFLLRDELAFKSKTPYYIAMVLDPLLRCNWIFYAIYANEVQQSAKVSFFVSLTELLRRFLWVFFRVENEHCSNVLRFRASREIKLPFTVLNKKHGVRDQPGEQAVEGPDTVKPVDTVTKPLDEEARLGSEPVITEETSLLPSASEPQPAAASSSPSDSFGTRLYRFVSPALRAVGNTLQSAHIRDFERRKDKAKSISDQGSIDSDDDEDDEDDDEDDDFFAQVEAGHESARHRNVRRRHRSSRHGQGSIFELGEEHNRKHNYDIESEDARQWRDRYL